MIYQHYNDYEIISLIREGNNDAIELMFDKYSKLIYKKIYKFNLFYDVDDMFQEGQMILHKSINKFSEKYNKTFTRYFEQNLERKYITIINKRKRRAEIFSGNKQYIYESNHNVFENSVYYDILIKEIGKILTDTEKLVYTLRELNNYSVSYIKDKLGINEKVIYNSLHRAKIKINEHFKD
ncbi:MAG: sigma-70 family RNA polymerase sigma factor [Candidatus Izemoplasma sp.]